MSMKARPSRKVHARPCSYVNKQQHSSIAPQQLEGAASSAAGLQHGNQWCGTEEACRQIEHARCMYNLNDHAMHIPWQCPGTRHNVC